ncbi:MAG: hypothetical protein WBR18_11505 [Anaerolineales bacterium]
MDELMSGLTILAGLLFRLAIPLLATLVLSWALYALDRRWQREASAANAGQAPRPVSIIRCWLLNDCSPERRERCPAYIERGTPCWQHFRDQRGALPERCLDCPVFRRAPALGMT